MIVQRIGIPIYLQVKAHILEKINTGYYHSGAKLPTEREFASQLGISRNTVSAAYKELLLEGVLEARQGRGTFVADKAGEHDVPGNFGSRRERLLKVVDDAVQKAVEMGFTVDQFATIVSIRAKEMTEAVKGLRVAVVDETPEYIARYISQIRQNSSVTCETVTIDAVLQNQGMVEFLEACDMVIVTAECFQALIGKMGNSSKIATVTVVPNLDAIIRIARHQGDSALGVVAQSPHFVQGLERLLEKSAIRGFSLEFMQADDSEEIRRFVAKHSVLIVSEERQNIVRRWASSGQEIIPFFYEIDQGSLNQVLGKLASQT